MIDAKAIESDLAMQLTQALTNNNPSYVVSGELATCMSFVCHHLAQMMASLAPMVAQFEIDKERAQEQSRPAGGLCAEGHDFAPFGSSSDTLLHLQGLLYCRKCGARAGG